jgi:L-seryl-tRNA(Ser) seleniumtransferase
MVDETKDKRAVAIPAVEKVLQSEEMAEVLDNYRRDVVVRLVRQEIDELRAKVTAGKDVGESGPGAVAKSVAAKLTRLEATPPVTVINATGIVIHTNLGRSILSKNARLALDAAAASYCDLELDLEKGERTRRDVRLEKLICAITGCEAATVVNNNAGAVFLAINTIAKGREVITSRGELIEIGGSFRVPDVVASSGAILREVGTTNRTKLKDYESAISDNTALLLKTHTSNYRIVGFTEDVGVPDLVQLGKKIGVPVMVDLGSGYLAPEDGGMIDEPDVIGTWNEGPDVVTFSCDKLLWGPQGGIALGRKEYIDAMRKNPLWRVLRIDKITSAALGATLVDYLKKGRTDAKGDMNWILSRTQGGLTRAANNLARRLREVKPGWEISVIDGAASHGGGSVPGQEIPSKLVLVSSDAVEPGEIDRILRNGNPPIVGYFYKGTYAMNVLTLLPGDVGRIVERFKELP